MAYKAYKFVSSTVDTDRDNWLKGYFVDGATYHFNCDNADKETLLLSKEHQEADSNGAQIFPWRLKSNFEPCHDEFNKKIDELLDE